MNNDTSDSDFQKRVRRNTNLYWIERAAKRSWIYTLLFMCMALIVIDFLDESRSEGSNVAIMIIALIALSGVHELAKHVLALRTRLDELEHKRGR